MPVSQTRVSLQNVHMSVVVDNTPLPVNTHPLTQSEFVVTPFNAKSTRMVEELESNRYGESFKQSWPRTPFKLRMVNDNNFDVACTAYVDGKKAIMRVAKAHDSRDIKGYIADPERNSGDTRAFEFTLPRMLLQEEKDDFFKNVTLEEREAVGTIRVKLRRVTFKRTDDNYVASRSERKVDAVNKEVAKQKKVSAAAKAGNVVHHASTKRNHYDNHEHLGTLEVRYATKEELKQRGFTSKSIRGLNDAALRDDDDDEVVVCRPPKKPRTIVNIE